MNKIVIITASGSGLRANTEMPKQFVIINKKPVLFYTIEQFYKYSSDIEIIITLNNEYVEYWNSLVKKYKLNIKHTIVIGGGTRYHSVKNAINTIDKNSLVAIHDAVRPFIDKKTIERCFIDAEKHGNSVPFTNISDSIRKISENTNTSVDRSKYISIQTPQIFNSNEIITAYSKEYKNTFTDDASVFENNNNIIHLTEGNNKNIKITTAFDIKLAEFLLTNNY